jgi:hypothetical protein
LTSLAVVLLCLVGLLLILVHVVASAIVALIRGNWRRTVSHLTGVAAASLVVLGAFAVPIEWRFSLSARSYYEGERALAGSPHQQRWLLDAQFLGPDQTDLVYDESDSEAPLKGERFYREDRAGCSRFTERLDGHFYRQSFVC